MTVVADRGADIYPNWASVPDANVHPLGRAMADCQPAGGDTLFAAAAGCPWPGGAPPNCDPMIPLIPNVTASVELRYGAVEISRPRDEGARDLRPTVAAAGRVSAPPLSPLLRNRSRNSAANRRPSPAQSARQIDQETSSLASRRCGDPVQN